MKKLTFYRLVNIIIAIVYLLSVYIQKNKPIIAITWQNYWFPAFCIAIGLSLLFKTILFHSDSSLWLSVCLLLVGSGLFVTDFTNFTFKYYLPFGLIIPAISSLITGLFFQIMFQIKVFFILIVLSVPIALRSFNIIQSLWLFIITIVFSLWIVIIGSKFIPDRWNRDNRK